MKYNEKKILEESVGMLRLMKVFREEDELEKKKKEFSKEFQKAKFGDGKVKKSDLHKMGHDISTLELIQRMLSGIDHLFDNEMLKRVSNIVWDGCFDGLYTMNNASKVANKGTSSYVEYEWSNADLSHAKKVGVDSIVKRMARLGKKIGLGSKEMGMIKQHAEKVMDQEIKREVDHNEKVKEMNRRKKK